MAILAPTDVTSEQNIGGRLDAVRILLQSRCAQLGIVEGGNRALRMKQLVENSDLGDLATEVLTAMQKCILATDPFSPSSLETLVRAMSYLVPRINSKEFDTCSFISLLVCIDGQASDEDIWNALSVLFTYLKSVSIISRQLPLFMPNKPISQQTREELYDTINEWIYQKVGRPMGMDTGSQESVQGIERLAKVNLERARFSESEIIQISNQLGEFKTGWNKVPRTYIILHSMNQLDMMDKIIELDFNDYWIPVSRGQLPDCFSPVARSKFLQAQQVVLTEAADSLDGCRNHMHFADHEQIPYEPISILGFGAFAQVEKVVCKLYGIEYARKQIRRDRSFRRTCKSMKNFVTELEVLKKLDHRHIVKLVGSYTDPLYLALLMSPVADCTLADYLSNATALGQKKSRLCTFFGCLAFALAYLHRARIRHKDIKPQNILVTGDNILLTDFGVSRISRDTARSTTEGLTTKTSRYCAPEVANYEPRNSSSDIWSLGCVFVEIVTVLKDSTVQSMWQYFQSHGSGGPYHSDNPEGSKGWFQVLRATEPTSANHPLRWIEDMLQYERHLRPTAQALVEKIIFESSHGMFCGSCCLNSLTSNTCH